MSDKRVLVTHVGLSPITGPSAFWHLFIELGRCHADVFGHILGKLPHTVEWVKLLRQVNRAARDAASQAVNCILHSPDSPMLRAQLDDVFPAARQLRICCGRASPMGAGLTLHILAASSPQLLCKLQRVAIECSMDDSAPIMPLSSTLPFFLSR
jgi:hypothetical protein